MKLRNGFPRIFCLILLLAAGAHAQNLYAQSASLNLSDTIRQLGSPELRWDPFFGSGVFTLGEHYAAFYSSAKGDVGPVLFDNREVLNLPLPYTEAGELRFPGSFVSALTETFNRFVQDELSHFRIAAIVIDPGHGGRDTGAVGNHTINGVSLQSIEKDIVLKVSKLLYAKLTAAYPDKTILLTREGDTYPSLDDRVNMANGIQVNENEAIIYISIHANATVANPNARGYEIWYLPSDYQRNILDSSSFSGSPDVLRILNDLIQDEFITESKLLAKEILSQFDSMLGDVMPSRGLKEEAWFVVRNAHMPSILVELGFVSNRTDAQLMASDEYLAKFAQALYNGIDDFVRFFERSGGFTSLY